MHRTEIRKKLLANGYTPLPNKRKACFTEGWSKMSVTDDLIQSWHRHGRTPDTGVRLDELAGADLDVLDPDLQAKCQEIMVEVLGDTPLMRVGDPRKSMFIYGYTGEPVTKIRTGKYGDNEVEVLLKGCQFGAFGRHSDDHEYVWPRESPMDVPSSALPTVSLDQVRDFVAQCEALFIESGLEKKSDGGETGKGYVISRDLDWGMSFDVKDHGVMTVEDMQAVLEASGGSLRCSMEQFREDADNLSSGQASLDRDGMIVISDYGAGVSHMMSSVVDDDEWVRVAKQLKELKEKPPANTDKSGAAELRRFSKGFTLLPTEEKVAHITPNGEVVMWRKVGFGMQYPDPIRMDSKDRPRKTGHVMMDMMDTAAGLTFRPDREQQLVDDNGLMLLNTYTPPPHAVYVGGVGSRLDPFNALMQRVFADKADREWVRDKWLAYKIQHPWTRGPAVMSLSAMTDQGMAMYGTGRGSFQRLLGKLFGAQYVSEISFDTLAGKTYQSQYNDWLVGQLMVCVAEAKDTSAEHFTKRNARIAAYEAIKQVAEPGDTRQQIMRKGQSNSQESIFATLFIASNHNMPFEMPREDRRIYVTRSSPVIAGKAAAREVWEDIHRAMADPAFIAAVYQYLQEQDVSDYSPYDPVPMNAHKDDLADRSQSEITVLAREFIDTRPGDIIIVRGLDEVLNRFMLDEGVADPERIVGMVKHEVLSFGRRMIPGDAGRKWAVKGRQERPWVVRNYDRWCGEESRHVEAKVIAREICATMLWEKSPVRPLNK